jgi:hypothetical protein
MGQKRTKRKRPPTKTASNLNQVPQLLFLAVFLHVGFACFFGVISSLKRVASSGVCMMRRLLVLPASVMFGCFAVMVRGMRMMFRGLLMVLGCFL